LRGPTSKAREERGKGKEVSKEEKRGKVRGLLEYHPHLQYDNLAALCVYLIQLMGQIYDAWNLLCIVFGWVT